MNLVKKALHEKMSVRVWGWFQSKQIDARLLITKFREKYFSYSQVPNKKIQEHKLK